MTKHNLYSSKFTSKSPLQNNAQKTQIQSNYYPSVARVDSSLIESTCILPETLKQNASPHVWKEIQVKKNKNLDFKHKQYRHIIMKNS